MKTRRNARDLTGLQMRNTLTKLALWAAISNFHGRSPPKMYIILAVPAGHDDCKMRANGRFSLPRARKMHRIQDGRRRVYECFSLKRAKCTDARY